MTVNPWIPNPGTGNPVREGETLTAIKLKNGEVRYTARADIWRWWVGNGATTITHYQVSPLRVTEPATMSADEVLIRAREATIEFYDAIINTEDMRAARHDDSSPIQAILIYERDRAKPLAEVAPHTVEDVDKTEAERIAVEYGWKIGHSIRDVIRAGIKRGRELERGA